MVKSLNMYRVKDRNWTFASGIRSIDDLQAVIAHCLESRGMDETSAKSLSSDPALFFKPNKHDILVHVYPSGQIADVGKQSGSVNNVLTRLRIFNGRALVNNDISTVVSSLKKSNLPNQQSIVVDLNLSYSVRQKGRKTMMSLTQRRMKRFKS
jgi:hypothetical protein